MSRLSREARGLRRCKMGEKKTNNGDKFGTCAKRELLDGASCPSLQPRASVSTRRCHMSSVLRQEPHMQRAGLEQIETDSGLQRGPC